MALKDDDLIMVNRGIHTTALSAGARTVDGNVLVLRERGQRTRAVEDGWDVVAEDGWDVVALWL
jgi:hypothetical protein